MADTLEIRHVIGGGYQREEYHLTTEGGVRVPIEKQQLFHLLNHDVDVVVKVVRVAQSALSSREWAGALSPAENR